MDLTQLANLGEFIGGVAVVASLLYVGTQIRQNTDSIRETAEFDSSRSFSEWLSRTSLNQDQAALVVCMLVSATLPVAAIARQTRVFITSEDMLGKITEEDLVGVEAADAICNRLATDAGLDGTWVAWLSTPRKGLTWVDSPCWKERL